MDGIPLGRVEEVAELSLTVKNSLTGIFSSVIVTVSFTTYEMFAGCDTGKGKRVAGVGAGVGAGAEAAGGGAKSHTPVPSTLEQLSAPAVHPYKYAPEMSQSGSLHSCEKTFSWSARDHSFARTHGSHTLTKPRNCSRTHPVRCSRTASM